MTPEAGEPLLELRDFRYTYLAGTPRAHPAIRGVDLRIDRGERVAIVGPTQSGKSTLVDAFAHLLTVSPGQIFFDGQDIAASGYDRAALRRSIGIVFQDPASQLVEDIVGADVAFGPTAAGVPAAETRALVEESLDAVDLPYHQFRLRYVYSLSGGQRRRVAIAGVLAMQPPVLVLDEPMAGLDPRGRADLLALLRRLLRERGRTLIICSSGLTDAALLCDRVVVLADGIVVFDVPMSGALQRADELVALDVALPEPVRLASVLRPLFPALTADVLTEQQLASQLLSQLGAG